MSRAAEKKFQRDLGVVSGETLAARFAGLPTPKRTRPEMAAQETAPVGYRLSPEQEYLLGSDAAPTQCAAVPHCPLDEAARPAPGGRGHPGHEGPPTTFSFPPRLLAPPTG